MGEQREIRAALVGAIAVTAYMALVLASGRVGLPEFGRLLLFYLTASFSLWALIGAGVFVRALARSAHRSGREPFLAAFLRSSVATRWERDRCVSLLWPPLLFALLLTSFNAFKQMILPLARFRFDPAFTAFDRALFGGVDPWRITHAWLGSPAATGLVDKAYHGWFVPMSVGLVACAFLPAATYRLRTQYTLTYSGVWIGIGSMLAFLLPAAGPCFTSALIGPSPSFDALHGRLLATEAATGSPLAALRNQAMLLEALGSGRLRVGGGISAMPSVHNALAVLFALAAFRLNRVAGWVLAAYAVLIWIGSVHLGWHYAIDGLAAAALTVGLWTAAGRISDRLERPLLPAAPQPATA
jgi:hypothetical protein